MIDKQIFNEAIEFVKERSRAQFKINDAISEEFPDSYFYPYSVYENAYVKLLCKVMSDNYDATEDITYFIYDLDFGSNWKPGSLTDNGEDIDISTASKLYDYVKLCNERAKNS